MKHFSCCRLSCLCSLRFFAYYLLYVVYVSVLVLTEEPTDCTTRCYLFFVFLFFFLTLLWCQISALKKNSVWVECHERMARWFVLMDHHMKHDSGTHCTPALPFLPYLTLLCPTLFSQPQTTFFALPYTSLHFSSPCYLMCCRIHLNTAQCTNTKTE